MNTLECTFSNAGDDAWFKLQFSLFISTKFHEIVSYCDSIKVLAYIVNLGTYVLHQVCRLNVLHHRRHKVHRNHSRPSKASKIHLALEHRSCHKNWHENCSSMLGTFLEWLQLAGSFLTNRRLGPLCNIQLDYPLDKVPWNNILWLFTTQIFKDCLKDLTKIKAHDLWLG